MSSLHKQRLLQEETLRTSIAKQIIGTEGNETASFKDDRDVLEFILNAVSEPIEELPQRNTETEESKNDTMIVPYNDTSNTQYESFLQIHRMSDVSGFKQSPGKSDHHLSNDESKRLTTSESVNKKRLIESDTEYLDESSSIVQRESSIERALKRPILGETFR